MKYEALRKKVIEGTKWEKENGIIIQVSGKADEQDNYVPVESTYNGNHSSYYEHLRDFKNFKIVE